VSGSIASAEARGMLTKDILFGMNILTLAGFVVMNRLVRL
jgi:hypothetical protein